MLTEQLYQSLFRAPGETRPASKSVLERSIAEGVKLGLFGLGELKDEKPECRFYREDVGPSCAFKEIIIAENLCKKDKREVTVKESEPSKVRESGETSSIVSEEKVKPEERGEKKELRIRFEVPKGKVSNIMGIMNFLQEKFKRITLEIHAMDGSPTSQDYEDKIEETFRQLKIDVEIDEGEQK